MTQPIADVCLLLEGTYPYVAGGVSSWVHDVLGAHGDLSFDLVALTPTDQVAPHRYKIPGNVRSLTNVPLQNPPLGSTRVRAVPGLVPILAGLDRLIRGQLDLHGLMELQAAMQASNGKIGRTLLLDSEPAFAAIRHAYAELAPKSSFLDFFWSWRSLVNATMSVLLPPLPDARCYHVVSTGFAGLLGARMAAATGRRLILTEHGIYTNERRIEIAMADWLHRWPDASLAPEKLTRDLRDLWMGAFEGFARLTYAAADPIITLYRGNQRLQRRDGADPARLRIIPNGIDAARYAAIPRDAGPRGPTVALIGRVVPIKDIKTFIRAIALLRDRIPGLRAEMLGPQEEDALYAAECQALVAELNLTETFIFRGRVQVSEWLGRIDVNVLTSISEAQPLTILEAGAAGVPCVATDVGSCREMIEGDPEAEDARLGPGGSVTPVANPPATAEAIAALLLDPDRWQAASEAMQRRIALKFLKSDCDEAYAAIYAEAIANPARLMNQAA